MNTSLDMQTTIDCLREMYDRRSAAARVPTACKNYEGELEEKQICIACPDHCLLYHSIPEMAGFFDVTFAQVAKMKRLGLKMIHLESGEASRHDWMLEFLWSEDHRIKQERQPSSRTLRPLPAFALRHDGTAGVIYFLKWRGLIKIGKTVNLHTRLAQYRHQFGDEIHLVYTFVVPDRHAAERGALVRYKSQRVFAKEWFHLTDEQIKTVPLFFNGDDLNEPREAVDAERTHEAIQTA